MSKLAIPAEVRLAADDSHVADVWFRSAPRVGELLWMTGSEWHHRPSAFEVREVAHWVAPSYHPNSSLGDPIHKLCLYVAPVVKDNSPT